MLKTTFLLCCLLASFALPAQPIAGHHTFAVGDDAFLLDGKPFVIRCAEMHFARIPKDLWRHRLQMVHTCGFNAVCAYMFWNYHEGVRGRYDFEGEKDVAEFCRLAQEEGLWVVLRPGPYTCAEWEFGGLPWWLMKEDGIKLRSTDPRYLEPACAYLSAVGRKLKNHQVTHGGNILMVQVENEYGFWGEDKNYMRCLYEAVREAGFDVPAFCCNPVHSLVKGLIPELLPVVNFGSNPQNAFNRLREVRSNGPLMCGEYYPAWFDSWGERHNVKDARQCLNDLEYMLRHKASFSVYMAHGGTTFAWWAGCNAPFRPQTSSYDYDAPVSESGLPHPTKFAAMRELFSRYLNEGETIPDPPAAMPVQKVEVDSSPVMSILNVSSLTKNLPEITSEHPLSFEQMDFGYGLAVYKSTIPPGCGGELKADVRDLGVVCVDGFKIGYFDRRFPKSTVKIAPSCDSRTLSIVVEPMGRYNFGQIMHDNRKGILGEVTLDGRALRDWKMKKVDFAARDEDKLVYVKLPMDFAQMRKIRGSEEGFPAAFFKYVVNLEAKDTFLDMRDWKRGLVRVNGHWIGRYWSIGPTQTMYIPGCWLNNGENEIVIWDAIGACPRSNKLHFLDKPVLSELCPQTDYFTFRPRPKIARPLGEVVYAGAFANSANRQDVRFAKPVKGRYFMIESVNAWDDRPFASGGEIDLVDAVGGNIPHTKWTIAACDSEERRAIDGSAENLIDGQISNCWHTEQDAAHSNHPHYVVIDLGQFETIGGFNFTPLQDANGTGRIRDYRIYVSDDLPPLHTRGEG